MALLGFNLLDGDVKQTVKTTTAFAAVKGGNTYTVKKKPAVKKSKKFVPSKPRLSRSGSGGKKRFNRKPIVKKPAAARGAGGGGGGGGGSSAPQKASDKPQIAALEKLLKNGFAAQRGQKIANVQNLYKKQDAELVQGYNDRMGSLTLAKRDNEKAEADASFGNLTNRARETTDLLAQSAAQGAGETDVLRTQLMALRNWDANQQDVNRSYFDTMRSTNTAMTDLTADTRHARVNLATEALADQEQVWANYYNQRADAYTQIGNIHANPNSDSYNKKSTAFDSMSKEASSHWKSPGVASNITGWTGAKVTEDKLNNTQMKNAARPVNLKRPEGSTLKKWV